MTEVSRPVEVPREEEQRLWTVWGHLGLLVLDVQGMKML
jgi:hypothetical protein